MKKFMLFALNAVLFEFNCTAMDIPVKIFNRTNFAVVVRDFDFKNSIVDIGARRINAGEALKFNITPIAGEVESFSIVVEHTTIPILLKWVTGKGIGPFVQQPNTKFRAIKVLEPANGVRLDIINKEQLPSPKKVQELRQQNIDLEDLSEQTGFTQEELKALYK